MGDSNLKEKKMIDLVACFSESSKPGFNQVGVKLYTCINRIIIESYGFSVASVMKSTVFLQVSTDFLWKIAFVFICGVLVLIIGCHW